MSVKESIINYCLYQPRCHKEVRNKLYELGCSTPDVDLYVAELVEAGHLNEEAYARAIARGKFRMKQWGRRKIIEQLKFQQISDYCIRKGLEEIDEGEYYDTAVQLAMKKQREIGKLRNRYMTKQKIYLYLLQKGYEADIINRAVNEILKQ